MRMYCTDVVELIDLLQHMKTPSWLPLLMQFGDMKHSHIYREVNLPHLKKFRSATEHLQGVVEHDQHCFEKSQRPALLTPHTSSDDEYDATSSAAIMQPIIWKLASHRHFKNLPFVHQFDTPWDHKLPRAVFRGQLTGAYSNFNKTLSDEENCSNMVRCSLVLSTAKSHLIDAKLTTTRNRLPNEIHGVQIVSSKVDIQYMMRYKAIIMLEGNDVASGLKWSLLSQSVVMMPKPKHTSWAMEERLEAWVHYVPLSDDLEDVEEKMQWVLSHDDEARRISERASLWMDDLVFHPYAARDDRLIKEEILRRYAAHYQMAVAAEMA